MILNVASSGPGAKTSRQWQLTLNLGHTDITILQKLFDRHGNEKDVRVETLLAWHYFVNSEMVPAIL